MPIPNKVRTLLVDAINVMFAAIGSDGKTKMPPAKGDNKAPIAWEYWLSNHLMAQAKGRFDNARLAAIKAGIIFDHNITQRAVGTHEMIYSGTQVAVWLDVNKPSSRVDPKDLCDYLASKGVKPSLLAEATEAATKVARPPHVFKVSLATEVDEGK